MFNEYEQKKINNLKREIYEDYNDTIIVNKIIDKIEDDSNDQEFIKVYVRYLLQRIWFSDPSHIPAFGPIGGAIARGEMNQLLKEIHERVDTVIIESEAVNRDWLNDIIENIEAPFDHISILASNEKMYIELLKKLQWNLRFNYNVNNYQLTLGSIDINFLGYHGKDFQSDIIIMTKDACRLLYRTFCDPVVGLTPLYFEVTPSENIQHPPKVDFFVHSTIKITPLNTDRVKIYRVKDARVVE